MRISCGFSKKRWIEGVACRRRWFVHKLRATVFKNSQAFDLHGFFYFPDPLKPNRVCHTGCRLAHLLAPAVGQLLHFGYRCNTPDMK
jgi:hypothetical protein